MKLSKYTGLLLILLLQTPCYLYAVQESKPVHINIVTEHLPPFQISSPDAVLGFATEVVVAALAKTPYTFDINIYPWSRSYNMTLKKPNTCIYSIARTLEREDKFTWVNTIAKRNASFIGLASNNITINSIEEAKQYTTAVIQDDVTHQYLLNKGFVEGKNLYVLNDTLSLLKLLSQRQGIDFILVDAYTIKYRAQFNQLDASMFKNFYQINKTPLDYYFACNIQTSSVIIDEIRAAIANMKTTGEINKIIDEWQYPNINVN